MVHENIQYQFSRETCFIMWQNDRVKELTVEHVTSHSLNSYDIQIRIFIM